MLHRLKSLHDVTGKPTYHAEMEQVDQSEVLPTQRQTAAWIRQEQAAADAIAAREALSVLPYVPPWRYDWEAYRFCS